MATKITMSSQDIMDAVEEILYQKGILKRNAEVIESIAAVNFVDDEPDQFVFEIEKIN